MGNLVMKKSCGMCIHFASTTYKNWGYCTAPLPAWLTEVGYGSVWRLEGHPQNYAKDCDLFSEE